MAQGYEQGNYRPDSYGAGGDGSGGSTTAGVATGPRRARVGLIAFVAFLLELVIIGAGFNQAVTKHLVSYYDDHNTNSFVTSMVQAGLSLSWRLTPQHGDTSHIWLSELVGDVSILVLTALLILAIARGPITWGRAFFGIWIIVIVSTCLASIPALLVTKNQAPAGVDKATYAVFGGPNGYVFFIGAALGLVVALITSIVAIATRRPGEALAPAYAADETNRAMPEPPPPYYGDAAQSGWDQDPNQRSTQPSNQPAQSNRAESPTTAYPVVPAGSPPVQSQPARSEATTTLPRFDDQWQPAQRSDAPKSDAPKSDAPKSDGDSTATLPRFTGGETGTWPPQSPASAPPASAPPASTSPAEGQPTAAFPRPPDDEDLGQHPDHD